MAPMHLDEARNGAIETLTKVLHADHAIAAAALIDDLFGRISVTLWLRERGNSESTTTITKAALAQACGQYWTDILSVSDANSPEAETDPLLQTIWREGSPVDVTSGRLRVNDRVRHHTTWFLPSDSSQQLWTLDQGPAVVTFHGFKGGVGRTTILAGYAIACARRGQRVTVVDVDLDAPGVGLLLSADAEGTTSQWGTVDYMLEASHALPLDDYFHTCARAPVTGDGRIEVFPAGRLDDMYLSKLGRVDLDVRTNIRTHALASLLHRTASERSPDIILLDGRAGLSPAAGILLSGIAHLHVLVATSNVQSLNGLERVVRHLGYEQALRATPQRECVVVQAHVPDSTEAAKLARAHFANRVEQIFRDGYYGAEATEDDRTWSLADLDSEVAPHVPAPIAYSGRLAHFETLDEVADLLVSDPYHLALHRRIDERLGRSGPLEHGNDGEEMG